MQLVFQAVLVKKLTTLEFFFNVDNRNKSLVFFVALDIGLHSYSYKRIKIVCSDVGEIYKLTFSISHRFCLKCSLIHKLSEKKDP